MFLPSAFPFQANVTAFYPVSYVPSHARSTKPFASSFVRFLYTKVSCARRIMQQLKNVGHSTSGYQHLVNSFKVRFCLVFRYKIPSMRKNSYAEHSISITPLKLRFSFAVVRVFFVYDP